MKNIIKKFNQLNIAVIGDVMLDVFTYGVSERLSPEAPVPVIRIGKKNYCAGGAGNVSRNLQALGVQSSIFGVVGDDEYGQRLINTIENDKILNHILVDINRPTTTKERFVAGQQQLLRVDNESTENLTSDIEAELLISFQKLVDEKKLHAVIFSDYKKGVLSSCLINKIIEIANKNNILTALDPKPNNLGIVKNLTVLKPNRVEAFTLANYKDEPFANQERRFKLLEEAACILYDKYQPKYLVISLSADGIGIFYNQKLQIIPTYAKEVFDVSGAGDTLISALVASLSAGATIEEATTIANIASGIAVGKLGTSIVNEQEILDGLSNTFKKLDKK